MEKSKLFNYCFLTILSLFLLFSFSVLFYNKMSETFAQENKIVQCDPQIPIGEALEKNSELVIELTTNLRLIQGYASLQIKTAEDMISNANQCDISLCRPVDCGSYSEDCEPCLESGECSGYDELGNCATEPSCLKWSTCDYCYPAQNCTSIFGDRPCPQSNIETEYGMIEDAYKNIETAKKEIVALIDGEDGSVDRKESVCAKENEDIRTIAEEALCKICQINSSLSTCPKIAKKDVIKRKLDKSRQGFDNCSVSQTSFLQMSEGEIPSKSPLSCETVIRNDFQRKEPDCRCAPGVSPLPSECQGLNKKSLLNYYCCQ